MMHPEDILSHPTKERMNIFFWHLHRAQPFDNGNKNRLSNPNPNIVCGSICFVTVTNTPKDRKIGSEYECITATHLNFFKSNPQHKS